MLIMAFLFHSQVIICHRVLITQKCRLLTSRNYICPIQRDIHFSLVSSLQQLHWPAVSFGLLLVLFLYSSAKVVKRFHTSKKSWGFNTNFSILISHTHSVLKLDNMFSAAKVNNSPEPTKYFENNLPKTSHRSPVIQFTNQNWCVTTYTFWIKTVKHHHFYPDFCAYFQ